MALTTKASNGTMPQIRHAVESKGRDALFHSMREQALILDKTCRAGFGVLPAGTIMMKDANGLLIPYASINDHRSLAITDLPTTTSIIILADEQYKYAVGEDIILVNDTDGAVDGGAIVSITEADNGLTATIVFTNTLTLTNFTVALNAACYLKSAGTSPGADFMIATHILDMDVDTGYGDNAKGGLCSVVLSNAILYKMKMANVDAAALTDLGALDDDPYIVLK